MAVLADRLVGRNLLQPRIIIMAQPRLVVVAEDRGRDVHGVCDAFTIAILRRPRRWFNCPEAENSSISQPRQTCDYAPIIPIVPAQYSVSEAWWLPYVRSSAIILLSAAGPNRVWTDDRLIVGLILRGPPGRIRSVQSVFRRRRSGSAQTNGFQEAGGWKQAAAELPECKRDESDKGKLRGLFPELEPNQVSGKNSVQHEAEEGEPERTKPGGDERLRQRRHGWTFPHQQRNEGDCEQRQSEQREDPALI